jgi:hypothetical protein
MNHTVCRASTKVCAREARQVRRRCGRSEAARRAAPLAGCAAWSDEAHRRRDHLRAAIDETRLDAIEPRRQPVDTRAMRRRTPPLAPVMALALAALATSACGITSRHTLGPTVDSNGHFGVLFAATLGPVVGCARKVAAPMRAAAGVSTVDNPGGLDDSGVLAFDVGVGVDWLITTPRAERAAGAKADAQVDAAAGAGAEEPPAGWRLGKRLGVRTGWMNVGDVDAWTIGISGTLTLPLPRNLFSLGVEAGCDALVTSSGPDAPSFRCDLGLAFDVTNLHAVEGAYY